MTRATTGDRADLQEYLAKVSSIDAQSSGSERRFAAVWNAQRARELHGQRAKWTDDLAELTRQMRSDLIEATGGSARPGQVSLGIYAPHKTWIDHAVPWVITGVGVCLLLGFLVLPASLVGIGFLLTVQPARRHVYGRDSAQFGFSGILW